MVYCCVKNCKNSFKNHENGIKFHRFPKCEETQKKWLSVCKKDNINTSNARICSQHFNSESYTENGDLNKFAIPNECQTKVIIDFENICRFCLEKELYMKHIFLDDDDDVDYDISGMIEFCLGIKILEDDKLPKFLCEKCHNELLHCSTFHKKCFNAEERLKNILKQNDEQNIYESTVVTTTIPIKTDPLDINCTEHTEELCPDSINESLVEIKEKKVYEWTETESNHIEENNDIEKCEEIIIDESDIHNNIKNNYLNNRNENDSHNMEDENKTQCDYSEESDHIEKCKEILIEEFNIHDIDNFENNYSNIQAENNVLFKDNSISLNCTNDEKIIKKRKRIRRKVICPICGKLVGDLKAHIETHSGIKKHKCPHCDKKFSSKSSFNEHINAHLNLRSYKCNHCDKSFNSRKSLNAHDISHKKEERYECNICGRKFIHVTTYRYHMRVHNQIKKYKCDICSKDFITKFHLRNHYRGHTGEKPFKCNECDKYFRHSYTLSIHRRKVHMKEISYYCNKCNAGFIYKSRLNNHLKKCL